MRTSRRGDDVAQANQNEQAGMAEVIDTHAHLDEPSLRQELDEILDRARQNGVVAIVTIGTDAASSERSVLLAEQYPEVFVAVGIHPNYVVEAGPADWDRICELAQHPRVVAIGETGLDQYWDKAPLALQQDYFRRHIELSAAVGKPFIVHCRDAEREVVDLLTQLAGASPLRGVMHSHCASVEATARCRELGLWFSFSGMVTFKKNAALRDLVASLPGDRWMVETDCPYLAPEPHRGKRNEPAFVRHVAEVLASHQQRSAEEVAAATTATARQFFGI